MIRATCKACGEKYWWAVRRHRCPRAGKRYAARTPTVVYGTIPVWSAPRTRNRT